MDKMAELIALMDETKFNEKLTGKEVINHFRTRKDPKYLFDAEKADWMNDSIIIEEAEKVMNHDIFGWKFPGEIDYRFNPTTETSRDNEWSWSLFRTIYWQSLARAYALTNDEKYTKEFLHEMHQFIEAWPAEKYIDDHTFEVKTPFPGHAWRTIESGIRIYTTWLPCFEVFRKSDIWSEDDMASFLLSIRDHAKFLMGHYSNHDRSSNWLSMETSALYQIGVMFPEFKEAEEWRKTGWRRVTHEIMYCFSNDGIHMERTPIYHLVAVIAFMQAIEIARINGYTVPTYAKDLLLRGAKYVISLIKPDLSTPMIGDADRDDLYTRRSDTSIYEGMNLSFFPEDENELRAFFSWMYKLSGDEEFLYFASLRKEGKAPEKLDYSYPEGIHVLRSGWNDDSDYALIFGTGLERGERSTHSHNDVGHVELTLKGEDILTDSGRFIYRSSIWRDWREYVCASLAHNTLFVDNHEMGAIPGVDRVRGVRSMCNEFTVNDEYSLVDMSHNAYCYLNDPVFHRRKLILLPQSVAIIADFVQGEGEEDHDFRIMFNYERGKLDLVKEGASFETLKGTKFSQVYSSSVDMTPSILSGSLEPKGGWISYGYPVKVPRPQLILSYNGKAPFSFVTAIAPENTDVRIERNDDEYTIVMDGKKYLVTMEDVKAL